MNFNSFQGRSLKTRVTLFTLAIFLISLWALAFYASRMLCNDMQRLLADQQFSTVSILATEVNHELGDRLNVLEKVAGKISPALLSDPAALQTFLEERLILQGPFNAGVIAYQIDGVAIAGLPRAAEWIGVNYMDRDYLVGALKKGKATIGRPVIGKVLRAPVFLMAAPIRDAQGAVIGALSGVTQLGLPNFLDEVIDGRYGKTGGYLLIAPQHRQVITASDKSRIMETLPAAGVNPGIDRFLQGYEGSAIMVNPQGVEVLASDKAVPVAGWIFSAVLPTVEAFAPIRAMQQHMLIATVFLTLLAGGLTWWMLKLQLSPLLAAARMLAAQSDTPHLLQPLPIPRQDEIGELIGSFNRLLDTLAQREKGLKESEAFKNTILNSVAAEIAVVDRNGVIQAVNERWRRFSLENGVQPGQPVPHTEVGGNYLTACGVGADFTSKKL
jgi:HAMP domain-containing protein